MDTNRNYGAQDQHGRESVGARVDEARETLSQGAGNLGSMVSSIIEDLQNIIRGEVQLAKTEMKESQTDPRRTP